MRRSPPDCSESQVTRTNALEALVSSGWVRGLSDRDIEAALAETPPCSGVSTSASTSACLM
jgi:hypothetical protein